jgi:hypothetical protein
MRVISFVVAFLPAATAFTTPKVHQQTVRFDTFALNAESNGASDEKKKVIVLGGDGFCGWPTSLYLSDQGHDVVVVDNLSRRKIDLDLGCDSLTPITSMEVSFVLRHDVNAILIQSFIRGIFRFKYLISFCVFYFGYCHNLN